MRSSTAKFNASCTESLDDQSQTVSIWDAVLAPDAELDAASLQCAQHKHQQADFLQFRGHDLDEQSVQTLVFSQTSCPPVVEEKQSAACLFEGFVCMPDGKESFAANSQHGVEEHPLRQVGNIAGVLVNSRDSTCDSNSNLTNLICDEGYQVDHSCRLSRRLSRMLTEDLCDKMDQRMEEVQLLLEIGNAITSEPCTGHKEPFDCESPSKMTCVSSDCQSPFRGSLCIEEDLSSLRIRADEVAKEIRMRLDAISTECQLQYICESLSSPRTQAQKLVETEKSLNIVLQHLHVLGVHLSHSASAKRGHDK